MTLHKTEDILRRGDLGSSGTAFKVPSTNGSLMGWGTSVPSGEAGFAPGAMFIDTDGASDQRFFVNEGTANSCSFAAVASGSQLLTGGIAFSGSMDTAIDFTSVTAGTNTTGSLIKAGANSSRVALSATTNQRGIAVYLDNVGTSTSLTGMRLRSGVNPSSGANSIDNLLCQISVESGKNATTCNVGFFEFIPKGTNVIGTARVMLLGADSAGTVTYSTDFIMLHIRPHTRGDETMSGNDEMIRLENEAVDGNGRQMDSFIRCMYTSISAGAAADYLIDGGVATALLGTAVMRLPDDGSVCHDSDTGSGTDLQFSDFTGYLTVVVGTSTRYIPLLTNKPSALS